MRGTCRLVPAAARINFSGCLIEPAWCSGLFISSYLSLQLWLRLPASADSSSGIGLAKPWWREGPALGANQIPPSFVGSLQQF